jgi:plastocyanin
MRKQATSNQVTRSICLGAGAALAGMLGVLQLAWAQGDVKIVDIVRNAEGKFVFAEPDVVIKAGQSVGWVAKDAGVPHVLAAEGDNPLFQETAEFDSTNPVGQQFNEPGEITYICTIHPSMRGTITVVAEAEAPEAAPEEPVPEEPYKY